MMRYLERAKQRVIGSWQMNPPLGVNLRAACVKLPFRIARAHSSLFYFLFEFFQGLLET